MYAVYFDVHHSEMEQTNKQKTPNDALCYFSFEYGLLRSYKEKKSNHDVQWNV